MNGYVDLLNFNLITKANQNLNFLNCFIFYMKLPQFMRDYLLEFSEPENLIKKTNTLYRIVSAEHLKKNFHNFCKAKSKKYICIVLN